MTRHNEARYSDLYNEIQNKIMRVVPSVIVYGNKIPEGFEQLFFIDDSAGAMSLHHQKVKFPRIGAFEIYFNQKVIYSKLKTGSWPSANAIANMIKSELEKLNLPPKPRKKIAKKRKRFMSARYRMQSARQRAASTKIVQRTEKPQRSLVPSPQPKKKRGSTARPGQRRVKRERENSFDVDDYLNKYDFVHDEMPQNGKEKKRDLWDGENREITNDTPVLFQNQDLPIDTYQVNEPEVEYREIKRDSPEERPKSSRGRPISAKPKAQVDPPSSSSEEEEDEKYTPRRHNALPSNPPQKVPANLDMTPSSESEDFIPRRQEDKNFVPAAPKQVPKEETPDSSDYEIDDYLSDSPEDRKVPARPSDTQQKDSRPTSSEVYIGTKSPERPSDKKLDTKKAIVPQQAPAVPPSEPSIPSEEDDYEDDEYNEDFEDEVDEYVQDVSDDEYNSDFDNPEVLSKKLDKPEFNEQPLSKQPPAVAQESDYSEDEYASEEYSYESEPAEDEKQAPQQVQKQSPLGPIGTYDASDGEQYQLSDSYLSSSEEEEQEEEMPITKQYEIGLKVGKSTNKKITYSNNSNDSCQFELTSSDNFFMVIKSPFLEVEPGKVWKFQLKFPPVPKAQIKEYILTVARNGKQWERIKIVANYS